MFLARRCTRSLLGLLPLQFLVAFYIGCAFFCHCSWCFFGDTCGIKKTKNRSPNLGDSCSGRKWQNETSMMLYVGWDHREADRQKYTICSSQESTTDDFGFGNHDAACRCKARASALDLDDVAARGVAVGATFRARKVLRNRFLRENHQHARTHPKKDVNGRAGGRVRGLKSRTCKTIRDENTREKERACVCKNRTWIHDEQ